MGRVWPWTQGQYDRTLTQEYYEVHEYVRRKPYDHDPLCSVVKTKSLEETFWIALLPAHMWHYAYVVVNMSFYSDPRYPFRTSNL